MENQKPSSQPSEEATSHQKQEEKVENRISFMKKVMNMGTFGTLGLMLLAIPVSMYLLSQRQDIQQRASEREIAIMTPTPTPTAGRPLINGCGSYGDVDGNGVITANDAQEIVRHASALRPTVNYIESNADVDHNGTVDVVDGLYINRYVSNLPTYLAGKKLTDTSTLPVCVAPRALIANCGTMGDVDGDGFITLNDVDEVARHVTAIAPTVKYIEGNADVDRSGTVDIVDALYIGRYVSGLPTVIAGKPLSDKPSLPACFLMNQLTPSPTPTPTPCPRGRCGI